MAAVEALRRLREEPDRKHTHTVLYLYSWAGSKGSSNFLVSSTLDKLLLSSRTLVLPGFRTIMSSVALGQIP